MNYKVTKYRSDGSFVEDYCAGRKQCHTYGRSNPAEFVWYTIYYLPDLTVVAEFEYSDNLSLWRDVTSPIQYDGTYYTAVRPDVQSPPTSRPGTKRVVRVSVEWSAGAVTVLECPEDVEVVVV